jgi:hypothetical protein
MGWYLHLVARVVGNICLPVLCSLVLSELARVEANVQHTCNGNDPQSVMPEGGESEVQWVPCTCGLIYDDQQQSLRWPHDAIE